MPKTNMQKFNAEKATAALEKSGLSAIEVSRRMGRCNNYVTSTLKKGAMPTAALSVFCDMLGISTDDLTKAPPLSVCEPPRLPDLRHHPGRAEGKAAHGFDVWGPGDLRRMVPHQGRHGAGSAAGRQLRCAPDVQAGGAADAPGVR